MKSHSLVAVLAVLLSTSSAFAADPLEVAPTMYKKLFENDQVRVMELTFKPGEKIEKHSHPDHFITVLEPGTLKIFKSEGTPQVVELKKQEVVWIPAETHWAENTGKTVLKLLVTELKAHG